MTVKECILVNNSCYKTGTKIIGNPVGIVVHSTGANNKQLCKMFNLSSSSIISHKESYDKGYGSNHGDIDHWLAHFSKNMDWFRSSVENLIKQSATSATPKTIYRAQVGAYANKTSAEALLEKLKKDGYDGFIVKGEK